MIDYIIKINDNIHNWFLMLSIEHKFLVVFFLLVIMLILCVLIPIYIFKKLGI